MNAETFFVLDPCLNNCNMSASSASQMNVVVKAFEMRVEMRTAIAGDLLKLELWRAYLMSLIFIRRSVKSNFSLGGLRKNQINCRCPVKFRSLISTIDLISVKIIAVSSSLASTPGLVWDEVKGLSGNPSAYSQSPCGSSFSLILTEIFESRRSTSGARSTARVTWVS